MAKAIEYEFAEIDSKEEVVVHLGNLADEMQLGDLAGLFGISQLHIIVSLGLPHNWEIARAFYRTVRAKIDHLPQGGPFNRAEKFPLPIEAEVEFEEVQQWLAVIYTEWGEVEAYLWPMPQQDLYLPLSPYLLEQLQLLYFRGPRRDRIFEVERVDHDRRPFAEFEFATQRLERAIAAKYEGLGKQGKSYAEVMAGVGMAKTVVDLQHRHWESERSFGSIDEDTFGEMQQRLAPLDNALDELEDAAWAQFEAAYLDDENAVADELLDLLDAGSGPTPLHVLIKAAFMRPEELDGGLLDRVVDVTLRACSALAQSMRIERFVHEHVVDIFEEEGRDLQETARHILREDGGKLAAEVIDEWEATIVALRQGSGDKPAPPSPLVWVARGVRTYRLGLSAVSAILEQGVVAQVMLALNKGIGGSSITQSASRGFAQIVLRSLANSAVKHRAQPGVLYITRGGLRLQQVMRELGRIDEKLTDALDEAAKGKGKLPKEFWAARGKELKDLQVRTMPRTAAGASVRVGVSLVHLVLVGDALSRNDDDAGRWTLLSAALSLGEHGTRALEFVAKGAPRPWLRVGPKTTAKTRLEALSNFDRHLKYLAGVAAAVGLVGNAYRARTAFASCRTAEGLLEVFGGASNAAVCVGQAFMGLGSLPAAAATPRAALLLRVVRVGAVFNVWGVAIGIATFIAQVIYDELFNVGTRPILLAHLATLERLARGPKLRPAIAEARNAADACGDALSVLLSDPGASTDDCTEGKPTYWKAAKLGFSKSAIITMFDQGMRRVEVGIAVDEFFDIGLRTRGKASVRVTFVKVEVIDPGLLEGDEGMWSLVASVNGERVAPSRRIAVTQGTSIDLDWGATLEVESLDLSLEIENQSPASMTGEPPPSIPRFHDSLTSDSHPSWGEGNWSLTKGDSYTLFYTIELVTDDSSGPQGPT